MGTVAIVTENKGKVFVCHVLEGGEVIVLEEKIRLKLLPYTEK